MWLSYGALYLELGRGAEGPIGGWTGVVVEPHVWTHLVITDREPDLKIYRDGGEVHHRGDVVGEPDMASNDEPLYIGSNTIWPQETFRGLLDDVRLFDTALDDTTVDQLHTDPYGPHLHDIAWYGFDELVESDGLQWAEDLTRLRNPAYINPYFCTD
jgi:hypothetical protein